MGKTAGYRYQVRSMTVPEVWVPGGVARVHTEWENVGVAPHYEPTQVVFRLYGSESSTLAWEGRSSVDLQTLLPTGEQPVSVPDLLSLPTDLTPGVYQLRLVVLDPQGYRLPLKLALRGRQADGSYFLGNVVVGPRAGGR
jgi:hypothetical protein